MHEHELRRRPALESVPSSWCRSQAKPMRRAVLVEMPMEGVKKNITVRKKTPPKVSASALGERLAKAVHLSWRRTSRVKSGPTAPRCLKHIEVPRGIEFANCESQPSMQTPEGRVPSRDSHGSGETIEGDVINATAKPAVPALPAWPSSNLSLASGMLMRVKCNCLHAPSAEQDAWLRGVNIQWHRANRRTIARLIRIAFNEQSEQMCAKTKRKELTHNIMSRPPEPFAPRPA